MADAPNTPDSPKKKLPTSATTKSDYIPPWEKRANEVRSLQEVHAQKAALREINHKKFVHAKWRRQGVLVAIVALIVWFYNPHGIFVLGDPLSVGRYRTVLKDLKKQMPAEYDLVKNHIDKIKIAYFIPGGNYAGYAQETPDGSKSITLLENTFIQGPGYAHSVLVHEACHGLQFEKELPFVGFCNKQSREHACNQMGLKVLYQFGGKPEMIAHYERIAGGKTEYGNSCMRNGSLEVMPEL